MLPLLHLFEIIGYTAAVLYAICMIALCISALHSLSLLLRYRRHHTHAAAIEASERHIVTHEMDDDALPTVLIQLPIFNERDVVCRIMDAAAALDWPRHKLHIQVLDDSTDDCLSRSQDYAQTLRQQGIPIEVLHRSDRTGYKAGALEYGMSQLPDSGAFICIFDADFVPRPDFLKRAYVPFINNEHLALVQGRWNHLNRTDNMLCRAQAIGIDGHFAIEQGARAWSGLAMNFNGTCGMWRRTAIVDAGGWEHDTLTEDMDISYRAQLRGWECTFRSDLDVYGEIPDTVEAWFSQQFRWAKGSIQTARKLLPRVWASDWAFHKKMAASLHMTHYIVHPLMVLSLICAPLALLFCPTIPVSAVIFGTGCFIIGMGSPFLLYASSQYVLHGWKGLRRMLYFPALASLGCGIAISNSRAVWEALRGQTSPFVRTPKKGDTRTSSYKAVSRSGLLELLCSLWALLGIAYGFTHERYLISVLLFMYVSGFAWTGFLHMRNALRSQTQAPQDTPSSSALPPRLLVLCGIALVGLTYGIASLTETWQYQPLMYCVYGSVFAAVYFLAALLCTHPSLRPRTPALFIWIMLCGILMRICLLYGMPASDDLNRYVVEGQQVARGQNPYIHAPHAAETIALIHLHVDPATVAAVNHPQWTAIYPPLSLYIESFISHLSATPLAMKISVAIAELMAVGFLCAILLARQLPWTLVLLAWWNPIGIIWLCGEGHNDAWMLCALMAGLYYFEKARPNTGFVLLSCAALCKPFAAWMLLPFLLKSAKIKWLIPLSCAALAYLPFMNAGSALFSSLGRFGGELQFHGVLEPLLRYSYSSIFNAMFNDTSNVQAAVRYTLMSILFIGSALILWRNHHRLSYHGTGDPLAVCAKLIALVFICLPTLYPWYLIPLVYLLPFIHHSRGLILWTALAPMLWFHGFAMAANNGTWTETWWVIGLAHAPAMLWLAADIACRSRLWAFSVANVPTVPVPAAPRTDSTP